MGLLSRLRNQYDSSKRTPDKDPVYVKNHNGKDVTLLPPQMKGRKAAYELRTGQRFTNNFEPKYDDNGQIQKLTEVQRAFRSGYLEARKDIGKAAASQRAKGK